MDLISDDVVFMDSRCRQVFGKREPEPKCLERASEVGDASEEILDRENVYGIVMVLSGV